MHLNSNEVSQIQRIFNSKIPKSNIEYVVYKLFGIAGSGSQWVLNIKDPYNLKWGIKSWKKS